MGTKPNISEVSSRNIAQKLSEVLHCPQSGGLSGRQNIEYGRLSTPVLSQQSKYLSSFHFKIQVFQSYTLIVGFVDPIDREWMWLVARLFRSEDSLFFLQKIVSDIKLNVLIFEVFLGQSIFEPEGFDGSQQAKEEGTLQGHAQEQESKGVGLYKLSPIIIFEKFISHQSLRFEDGDES